MFKVYKGNEAAKTRYIRLSDQGDGVRVEVVNAEGNVLASVLRIDDEGYLHRYGCISATLTGLRVDERGRILEQV